MKTTTAVVIILVLVIAGGIVAWKLGVFGTTTNTADNGQTTPPVANIGEHCGGNIANAAVCIQGSRCAPTPGSNLPFGDVGGTCVADSAATSTGSEAPKTVTITYNSAGFSPKTITINKGDTVKWVNNTSGQMWIASAIHPTHTVYSGTSLSEHCPDSANDSFDQCAGSGPGTTYSFTFDKVGSWPYHDHLHASKAGNITVQ